MIEAHELRYHVEIRYASTRPNEIEPTGSCCARGPIHAARRILRSFPEFRGRRILAIHVDPCPTPYFGTDR